MLSKTLRRRSTVGTHASLRTLSLLKSSRPALKSSRMLIMVSHFMKSTQHSGLPKQMLTRETLHLWSAQEPPHPCSNPQQCFAAPTVSNRCHGPLSQCWSLGAQTIKSAFTTLNAGRCRQLSSQITRQRRAWTAALQMITSSFLLVTRMASSAFMT